MGSTGTGSQRLLHEHCNSMLSHGVKLCRVFPQGNFSGIFFYQLVNKTSPSCFQISCKCHLSRRWSTSSVLSLARPGLAFTRNRGTSLKLHQIVAPERLWGPEQETSLQGLEIPTNLSYVAGPTASLSEPHKLAGLW